MGDQFRGGDAADLEAARGHLLAAAQREEEVARGIDTQCRAASDAAGVSTLADAIASFGRSYARATAHSALDLRTLATITTTQATQLREASE